MSPFQDGGGEPVSPLEILAAGDRFVLTSLLARALRAELADPVVRELTLPWPVEPSGQVAEVGEASGTEAEMIEALDGAEVCVTQMAPVTEKVLAGAPALKLVVVARGVPANVNLAAATARGVRVCHVPGRDATATAEFTIGMLLATLRRIPETHVTLALHREWIGAYGAYDNCGLEVAGTTVGLVGYGAVGSRVAHVLAALGARVLVYDPYVTGEVIGERVDTLDDLLARSRIVTLHARLTHETRGLIGAREIGLLPAGSVLINVASGPLLDHDALCEALESRHLMAAGLDTFDEEPVPEGSRLFQAPSLVMTPHLGCASRAVAERSARIVAAEVGRYARREPLAHCLNL